MRHLLLAGTGVCALAILAPCGVAQAVPALSMEGIPPLVLPVVDEEDLAVEEDMRPDEPPEALEGEEAEDAPPMMEGEEESEASGDMEDEMLDKVGPGAE